MGAQMNKIYKKHLNDQLRELVNGVEDLWVALLYNGVELQVEGYTRIHITRPGKTWKNMNVEFVATADWVVNEIAYCVDKDSNAVIVPIVSLPVDYNVPEGGKITFELNPADVEIL